MKWNRDCNRNSLKWKLAMLGVVLILMVILLIVQINLRKKERNEYQKTVEETKIQEQEEKEENVAPISTDRKESQENNTDQKEPDQKKSDQKEPDQKKSDQKESDQKESDQEKSGTVCIVNLDEFAETLMGENKYLLTERLGEWIKENQLNTQEGTIFHVMVPESDPQSINFYLRLSDKRGSLVMLSYHPRENIVTASICNYTEEEIKNEIWEADNGPAERDVPAEEDTGGTEIQEEMDDITGET